MSCSLRCFWRTTLVFSLGLVVHCGKVTINTEAQAGPLYRVEGSLLSISCNVSGFTKLNTNKEFEFRVKKPNKPSLELNVISTGHLDFSYNMFLSRVRSKEITLTHTSPNSVIFEIQNLQKSDEGEYDCRAVDTEGISNGVYSATTTVKVIDNSLSVSSPGPTSLVSNEGDGLTLTCQASSNTVQHTHMSLAWYIHNNNKSNARLIIALDRDFTLIPGRGFEERYKAGLVNLDKIGEATYKLSISQLELSDQGGIYCQCQEWIQDPDRSWYSITLKDMQETALRIKSREVVTDSSSLVVTISSRQTTLREGHDLSLSCNIDTQNLEQRFFSVAWLKGGVELARIGPTGILSVGQEYRQRAEEGELRTARLGSRDYRLTLQPVRTSDHGEYFCRAWPRDRGQDGGFTQGAPQDSISQLVRISPTESGLSLEMQDSLNLKQGERLSLTCKVLGVKGQLSITWKYKAKSALTTGFTNIISLSQEGVVEKGGEFTSRKVKATRLAADRFTVDLEEVTPSDSGVYRCVVSEWKINTEISSQLQDATVEVAPADSFVRLNLISRNNMVTIGDNVELICRIRGIHAGLPITLAWSLQRDDLSLDSIVTVYSDGTISWSGEQRRYQLRVQNKGDEIYHYLLISGASHWEEGRYQCSASIFLENVHKQLRPSNQLALKVQNPVQKLSISNEEMEFNVSTSQNFSIPCDITKQSSQESEFQVTWFWQKESDSEHQPVLTVYRNATFQMFGRDDDLRFSHPLPDRFHLTVLNPGPDDSGLYFCEVEEWFPTPSREWRKLAVEKSGYMTVGIYSDGNIKAIYESECDTHTWIWILVVVIICALLVIFILVLKMRRSMGGKTMNQTLWMEQHHLNSKPSVEDGA
ncbi:immunoglobulin superfamily member 3-like [Antennarius striatus]|uniref:immunoglobulin superfamily member 3-like n=1 Tax=Antennarius striatus TaxID=241820 RepID=UPI0035AFE5F4